MGVRLRTRFELARCVCRLSSPQARARRRTACDPDRPRGRLRHEGTVSFRLRVTLLTAAAVAVAAIGASIAMYFIVEDQLINQVDQNLQAAAAGPIRDSGGPF